jgi:hypothetical protein
VEAACKELLASPGFAYEQNGHAATRRYLGRKGNDFPDGRALTYYMGVPAVRGRQLRSGCDNYTVPFSRGQSNNPRAEFELTERIGP